MGMANLGNRLFTGETSVDFVGRRRTWYLIAAALMLGSLIALITPGLHPGLEFTGGSEFRVSGVQDTGKAREAVGEVVDQVPLITQVGSGNDSSVRVQLEQLPSEELDAVKASLAEAYSVQPEDVTSSSIGPSWGADITSKALLALVVFFALVAVVLALYFRTWAMAVAAMVALVHDLLITAGIYALVGFEVTPASVIGFLTILGYSLYDTVVVFDKVRENTQNVTKSDRYTYGEAANLAVNQTVVRSVNTSVVALLPVAAILFIGALILGAGTLRDIALALFVGMLVGTYSSIFIATPLLVDLRRRDPAIREHAERLTAQRSGAPIGDAPAPA
ncbi:preprotein translocase subunit SecF [Kineococcus xinjiangensis]|uniref:Protein-export membrane protein SecF n=1 Tax=Kineococcus xinjiangensis TaxID=512762 RepID=A0A2S6IP36_9ACTN|nr:protein translocase subunit SecF [Kineococcus xinjiangensis]PPK95968.1 preprotein translocase subunit SecF [Kineococcus xinjiangensis]